MSEVKMFRSQLGGFNREDVNNYIKNADTQHAREIEDLAEQNRSLQEQLATADELREQLMQEKNETIRLKQLLEEAGQRTAALEKEAEDSRTACRTAEERAEQAEQSELNLQQTSQQKEQQLRQLLSEQAEKTGQSALELEKMHILLDEQAKQLAQQEQSLREYENQTASLTQELEQVRTAQTPDTPEQPVEDAAVLPSEETAAAVCDPLDKDSPAYKISMYDKISSQLGDILIHANRNAEEILSAAKEEAERLRMETAIECEQKRTECDTAVLKTRTETEEEAAYIRDRLSQTAETLLSHVSTDLHGNIENCVREINTGLTDMQYEFQALLAKISARSAEMDERVRYYQTCVSEEIEKKLKDMDEKYGLIPSTDEGQDA